MLSGGIGSFFAAKRVIEEIKKADDNVVLLFSDTLIEDEDLYRFLEDIEKYFRIPITRLKEGRTPWDVFFDVRFLGNSRIDPCSRILKRELLNSYVKDNFTPDNCIVYLGIDWTEEHRMAAVKQNNLPYKYIAPLCEPPLLQKSQFLDVLENECKIKRPRLYDLGFKHNNCGGFCIKSGQAQFRLLLEKFPDRYKFHEDKEQELIAFLGKRVAFLRITRNKVLHYVTLKEFREHIEKGGDFDKYEWGGCGCAV